MSISTEIQRLQSAKENIKNAIEESGVSVGNGLLDTYPDKINEVFENGKNDGKEWLWDIIFKNKKNNGLFQYAFHRWSNVDFGSRLDGIKYKNVFWMFAQSEVKDLDIIFDLTEINSSPNNMFYGCSSLERIKKIIFSDNGVETYATSQMFYAMPKLKEIRFEGVLDNSTNISSSPLLSKDSIRGSLATEEELAAGKNLFTSTIDGNTYYGGLITLLSSTKGATLTMSNTAVINAFGSVDAPEWIELITPKSNKYNGLWTITLS